MLTFAAAPPTPSPNPKSNPNSSLTPRKPLQPKNRLPTNINNNPSSKPTNKTPSFFDTNVKNHHESNKENNPQRPPPAPKKASSSLIKNIADASLAEELKAIREKMERMRLDKEETEKMLRDRELLLDTQMGQLLERGNLQRMLEIQVDRLYRLNQLRSSCLVSPIRSLRDKQIERKINEDAKSRSMKIESSRCGGEVMVSGSTSPKSETASSALQYDDDQASEIEKGRSLNEFIC